MGYVYFIVFGLASLAFLGFIASLATICDLKKDESKQGWAVASLLFFVVIFFLSFNAALQLDENSVRISDLEENSEIVVETP